MPWFRLTSGSPTNPNNYSFEGNTPPTDCLGTDQICTIQAANNGSNKPVLTASLKDEMIDALHDGAPSDNVQLKTS